MGTRKANETTQPIKFEILDSSSRVLYVLLGDYWDSIMERRNTIEFAIV